KKSEIKKKTFFLAMLVFVLKLLLNDGLEFGLSYLFEKVLNLLQLIKFIPIFITALILPFQFLVFNKIFKEPQYEAKDEKVVQAAKFNQLNIYLKYTLLFIIILIIGLLPIEIKNQTFLFSGLFVDR